MKAMHFAAQRIAGKTGTALTLLLFVVGLVELRSGVHRKSAKFLIVIPPSTRFFKFAPTPTL